MINLIWTIFITVGIFYSIISGNIESVNKTIMSSANEAINVFMNLFPNMILWSGILNILVESDLIMQISKLFYPIISKLFKNIKKNDESIGYISISFLTNILGLSNAGTIFSIKALNNLKDGNKINKNIITYLVILVSSSSFIPTTILSIRNSYNSVDPSLIIFPIIISGTITFIITLILNNLFGRLYD